MVITDVPFDAQARGKNYSRYSSLRQPGATQSESEDEDMNDAQDYAAFLKEQERKVGYDGFLDSRRFTHTYEVADSKQKRAGTPRPSSRTDFTNIKPNNSVNILLKAEQDKKDHEKRIKVIEDHMWQHKQEERELKRVEGDVLKKRHAVRHTLRDYENNIQKQKLGVDQTFNKGMEKFTKLQQQSLHQKVETIKQRGQHNEETLHQYKDSDRKVELAKTDLARKYRTAIDELEMRQVEHNHLVSEYENKLKTKEQEQFELKKQLAEFAIKLNMESMKGREQNVKAGADKHKDSTGKIKQDLDTQKSLDVKLGKGDQNVKTVITQKRKLSADLTLTRAHLGLKNREEIRQLQDTRNDLAETTYMQKKLNEGARQADLDLQTKQIEKKLQVHEARKNTLMHHAITNRKEKSEAQEKLFAEKFQKRFNDMAKREHEDHLRHFQKMVTKGEEEEQRLYNKVREAEYSRQKQEQNVKRTQSKLQTTKSKNAQEIKKRLMEMSKEEKDLEQKLLREQGQLDKLHSEREESYEKLQKHRELLKNDHHNLEKHDKEHLRLQKIAAKAGSPAETYA